MVNYCCATGCGRNSKLSKHLNYHVLPKERERQVQWLTAVGRDDLLDKDPDKLTYRICSRHFAAECSKNRNLSPDAVPTLYLPGSDNNEDFDEKNNLTHEGVVCNSCNNVIQGFRYKCITCADFDLCQKCESSETHQEHYMLRIPKPLQFLVAEDLSKKWKRLFKAEHAIPVDDSGNEAEVTDESDSSSDDESLQKYSKNYDSGLDLSEDIKSKIRKEVTRVLRKRKNEKTENKQKTKRKKGQPRKGKETPVHVPEVVFADVNEIKECHVVIDTNDMKACPVADVKNEDLSTANSLNGGLTFAFL